MSSTAEHFRPYLILLARQGLDERLQAKVDISGVVQQTLFEANKDWHQVEQRPTNEQTAWLRKLLANNLRDEARKWHTAARNVDLEQSMHDSDLRFQEFLAAKQSSPSHAAARNEDLLRLAHALLSLPDDQRDAIEQHHLRGLPLAAVAVKLNRSKGAVAALLYRGTQQLRQLLQDKQTEE